MLVDINPDLEMPEFKLTLMRRNETEIAELGNVYDVVYDHYFAEIDELTFNIPYNIMSNNHDKIKNPNYDLVKGDFLINLNDMYYFIIDDITEQDSDGELYKEVHCYSREYELVDKKIRGYQFDARKIYVDPLSTDPMKDENDFYWGILNYMETLTTWRVDYINSSLLDIYRGFDISEDNLISIIQQLQTSFDCLFQFDTVNKKFNIYKLSELGQNKGLYISDENYIENLTKDIKHDEIKTRLYLYGKDNISVEDINLTGQPYIENFDFYKTTEYMSQDLIDALDDYEAFLLTKESEFQGYLDDLATYEGQLATKQDELATLQEELAVIEQDIDIAIANGDSISTLNSQKDSKLAEISTKEGEIDTVQGNIDTVNSSIETLQNTIAAETYLTTAQLEELDPFIKYETYSDSSYVEETKDELLEYGLEMLNQISQPSYEFNIDSVDFLSVLEAQHDWEKLVVGDIVNLRHTKINDMIVEVRLVHYQYQITDKKLELEFSNRNNINDPYTYNRDLMKKLSATSTSVDFSKYGWDEAPEAKSAITQYIDSQLDLAKQSIIQGDNQAPILDERGLWLRKKNPDGTYDLKQVRAVNNVIALTQDGWETVSVAITPDGIVAENIYGELGAFATVKADQITVGDGLDPAVIEDSGAVIQGAEYNYVQINPTDGLKATHLDGSNTQISGDGVQRNLAIPNYIKTYTGVSNVEDFDGETISTLESKGWEFSANKNNFSVHPDGYLVLDDNVNEPGYDIGMVMARKYVYISADNATYSYDFKMGSTDDNSYRFMLDGNSFWLPERSSWDTGTGTVSKGWHVFQWEGWNQPYDVGKDIVLHLDNIVFEDDVAEYTLDGYTNELKEYNYITYLGTGETYNAVIETMTGDFGGLSNNEIKQFIPNAKIKLPEEFKGKDFNIVLSLKDTGSKPLDDANVARIELDVVSKNTVDAEFEVRGIITWSYFYNDGGLVTFPEAYTGLAFTYYVTY
jgi:hypothetical protein